MTKLELVEILKGEKMIDSQYQTWWDSEGCAMRPTDDENIEEFAHRITQIAWLNSTFKNNEKLQVLMGKHTTFPIIKQEMRVLSGAEEVKRND